METGEYHNGLTIPNEAQLLRRIPPWHFIKDENLGQIRPSSAAFDNDDDGSPMSVTWAEMLAQISRSPTDVLTGHEGFALASITAGLARECEQGVAPDPLPEDPAHAVVFGEKPKRIRRKLAYGSYWVISPPDP
jgi:hypothetical protein